ncbi:hypothetical protein ABB37_02630 [Leptomonas pyrrhocoris]|uniref:CBF1-interacting co-repressor CIR N-terminal domain-containing protein n=1 Tax=Leptomonas pyrrhocoris TaxID=157538 RepID=A0A0M9G5Y4_LEPPY|nr:hypothetical protein ABB37_02630 [Leptomonas pyrrhocoris]KPA82866.1 hypothetical protein ABB37_02630 [Leptomonas pyrrhocoris]|eukprot:XP_015661305.1 hypothetical protein ABB37_02630 [Leptomonas pyrrhocoris]
MYRAHSKDINRNKSFHPLTYGNLRRVELLKEGDEEKKQRAAERQKELQHDQEERRYDELALANSADSLSGELARFRQTKNIFKAEYEAESAKRQHEIKNETGTYASTVTSSSALSSSPFAAFGNAFLSKFKKEGHAHESSASADASLDAVKTEVKAEPSDESASSGVAHRKRQREDDSEEGSSELKSSGVTTGFVTSAEAAQLRKELNLAQKQRHDPLLRVRQYQNSCVATAAREQQQQHTHQQRDSTAKDNSEALQSRIRELLARKKEK